MNSSQCPVCRTESIRTTQSLGGFDLFDCPSCALRFAPEAFDVTVDYSAIYDTPEYIEEQVRSLSSKTKHDASRHPTYRSW
jgi:ribosomal protein L37AE/L43A